MAVLQISALPTGTAPTLVADLIPVSQAGQAKKVSPTALVTGRIRGIVVTGISINATGDLATIDLSTVLSTGAGAAKFILSGAVIYDASTSLAGTAANTLDIRTAAAGGGISLVTPASTANLQTLTGATKTFTLPVITTTYATAATLYARLTTSHGSAATISMLLQLTELV